MGLGNKEDQGQWKQKSTAFPHFTINSTVWKLAFRMPVSEIKNQSTNHKRYLYWTVNPFYSIQLMWAEPINTPPSLFAFHMAYQSTTTAAKRDTWVCDLFDHTQKNPLPFYCWAWNTLLVSLCPVVSAHPRVLTEGCGRARANLAALQLLMSNSQNTGLVTNLRCGTTWDWCKEN